MELVKELGERAERILKNAGYKNVSVKIGDGFKGWREHGPYDRIIVTCAVKSVPQLLVVQLKVGGSVVLPVGQTLFVQQLKILTK